MESVCLGETDTHSKDVWGDISVKLKLSVMKSENDLKITGTIVSVVPSNPESKALRFRIVHNFGGGQEPLFLDCILILRHDTETPKKGMQVRVRSYLRVRNGRIEAVVKSIQSDQSE
jgi:hypothetical protein